MRVDIDETGQHKTSLGIENVSTFGDGDISLMSYSLQDPAFDDDPALPDEIVLGSVLHRQDGRIVNHKYISVDCLEVSRKISGLLLQP